MTGGAGWTEFRCPGDRAAQDRVIAEVVAPLPPGDGFFMRGATGGGPGVRIFTASPGDHLARALTTSGVAFDRFDGVDPLREGGTGPLGGPGAAEVVLDFLVGHRPMLATAVLGAQERRVAAIDIVVAHLVAVAGYLETGQGERMSALVERVSPMPLSFPSLRAHADGIIAMSKDPAALRRRLGADYARVSRSFEQRVDALLAQLHGMGPEISPLAGAWYGRAREARREIERRLREGDLMIDDRIDGSFPWDKSVGQSEVHRFAAETPAWLDYMATDYGYQSMRAMMGLLYLGLHVGLGITMGERLLLCHGVAVACESLSGIRGVELVAQILGALPGAQTSA